MSSVQTMKSWAVEIKSPDDIPRAFKESFMSFVPKGKGMPYTVYSPPYKSNGIKTNSKLMFTWEDTIVVLTKNKSDIEAVAFQFSEVDHIEHGSLLLTSWIRLEGIGMNHKRTSVLVGFATVMDYLFLKFIYLLRDSYLLENQINVESEKSKFTYLIHDNFKFMNYAKQSIHGGETVLSNIYEPTIDLMHIELFGRVLYQRISPAYLLILTDQEVILIKDPDSKRLSDYGATWTYLPLPLIQAMGLSYRDEKGYFSLMITLQSGEVIELLYRESNQTKMEEFMNLFQKTRG